MSDNSRIEWTQATWNPTTGCDQISAGCDNCYALTMAKRLKAMGQAKYQNDGNPVTSGPGFGLTLHWDSLETPLRWRTGKRVFVNSMSDLFHARVPLEFVRQVFDVIAQTPQHTYQVLTKRASRLPKIAGQLEWPPNLWMGVSVENDEHIDRIDDLRAVPAAVRFLSLEPLLGPLDDLNLAGIHWVIAGGESGSGARPMPPHWVRSIRDQCVSASVPFFFKQWGEWAPTGAIGAGRQDQGHLFVGPPVGEFARYGAREEIARVGKHDAGRTLDGREWSEFPRTTQEVPV
jgi:protein gp37